MKDLSKKVIVKNRELNLSLFGMSMIIEKLRDTRSKYNLDFNNIYCFLEINPGMLSEDQMLNLRVVFDKMDILRSDIVKIRENLRLPESGFIDDIDTKNKYTLDRFFRLQSITKEYRVLFDLRKNLEILWKNLYGENITKDYTQCGRKMISWISDGIVILSERMEKLRNDDQSNIPQSPLSIQQIPQIPFNPFNTYQYPFNPFMLNLPQRLDVESFIPNHRSSDIRLRTNSDPVLPENVAKIPVVQVTQENNNDLSDSEPYFSDVTERTSPVEDMVDNSANKISLVLRMKNNGVEKKNSRNARRKRS